MAVKKSLSGSKNKIESKPKKTLQGMGAHTKYSATSRNGAKKRYRGQGRWPHLKNPKRIQLLEMEIDVRPLVSVDPPLKKMHQTREKQNNSQTPLSEVGFFYK